MSEEPITLLPAPQAEHWSPMDSRIAQVLPALQAEAINQTPYALNSLDSVGIIEIEQANGVAFAGATPHTDRDFDRWFIMMTLRTPEAGTWLHTARKIKMPTKGPLKSQLSIPLVVGEICLFDAHRLHWVDRPAGATCDDGMSNPSFSRWLAKEFAQDLTLMIGTETPRRPTREEAEALLVDYLVQATPQCWTRAGLALPGRERRPVTGPGR